MDEHDIKLILKIILDRLDGNKFLWRIEGSANLKILGVDVSVRDLDITTDDDGIVFFRNALKEFIVNDCFVKKINARSLVCSIKGFEVEVNSYGDKSLNMFDKIEKIVWCDLHIPVLPLKCAKYFYELINRDEKVTLISKYLNHR